MSRLELQKSPSKLHARKNNRDYVRGYDTNPHDTWGESLFGVGQPPAPATGATAGIPGSWTPAGAAAPANLSAVAAAGIVASPATPWTTGQFVQTATAGAPGRVTWTGSAWVGGVAP